MVNCKRLCCIQFIQHGHYTREHRYWDQLDCDRHGGARTVCHVKHCGTLLRSLSLNVYSYQWLNVLLGFYQLKNREFQQLMSLLDIFQSQPPHLTTTEGHYKRHFITYLRLIIIAQMISGYSLAIPIVTHQTSTSVFKIEFYNNIIAIMGGWQH